VSGPTTPLQTLTLDAVRHIEATKGGGAVIASLGEMLASQFEHMLDVLEEAGWQVVPLPRGRQRALSAGP
jgi:hypothetical protein